MKSVSYRPVLVLGAAGQVGRELMMALSAVHPIGITRQQCDLSTPEAVSDLLQKLNPAVIYNAAAYTAVDKAETEQQQCRALNVQLPDLLAKWSAAAGSMLVHYSTDYVFDGSKGSPYREQDKTGPLNVYGVTKLEGEQAVLATCPRALVLRTSWVYASHGKNFVLTMLRFGQEREELKIVDDQIGSPTSAAAIARASIKLGNLCELKDAGKFGLYHLTAQGQTSWAGFASAIFAQSELERRPKITPISTSEYPTPANRPRWSVLNTEKLASVGITLPDWQTQLSSVMAELSEPEQVGVAG